MPTYEYRCPAGHEFEHFYRTISSAKAELNCPTCGQLAERKVSGGSGLVFKGSGFYITDYGKDGKKDQRDAAKKREAGKSDGSSGGESSSGGSTGGSSGGSSGGGEGGSSVRKEPKSPGSGE